MANKPEMKPQCLLVDGNGILHTRGFGIASHIGVQFDIPCVGVGKTVFAVDGLTAIGVKNEAKETLKKGGDCMVLQGGSGKDHGAAFRSTNDSSVPVIVSVGHRVSLQTALAVTSACIRGNRIPEPIRQADQRSRVLVKEHYKKEDEDMVEEKMDMDLTEDERVV